MHPCRKEQHPPHLRLSDSESEELRRVLRICGRIAPACVPLTFRAADDGTDWNEWVGGIFVRLILPTFLRALNAARSEEWRELILLDRHLDLQLPPTAAFRSRVAGRQLYSGLASIGGVRWIGRLAKARAGHYACGYAAAAAVFNFGDWNAVLALLAEEFAAGDSTNDLSFALDDPASDLVRTSTFVRAAYEMIATGCDPFRVAL